MTKNLSLKIWSLLIALATAFWVHSNNTGTVLTLFLPLKLKNLPDSKIVLLPLVKQVQVDIRGPAFAVSSVAQHPPSVVVDLRSGDGNRYTERLQPQNIPLPSDIEVVRIDPQEFEVALDDLMKRELPIDVSVFGSPHEDFRLKQITVTPKKVRVSGPKTVIQELENIKTQMVDIRALKTTETRTVSVGNPGSLTTIEPREVTVDIDVEPIMKEVSFEKVPVKIGGENADGFEAKPNMVSVEVTGPSHLLNSLKAESIQVLASPDPKASFPVSVDIQVSVPEGISLVYTNPGKVQLSRREVPTADSQTSKK